MNVRVRRILAACAVPLALAIPVPGGAAGTDGSATVLRILSQPFVVSSGARHSFVLLPDDPGVLSRGATLRISVLRRIANGSSFRSIAAGDAQPATMDRVEIALARVQRDSAGRLTPSIDFSLSRDTASSLALPADGVYPVVCEILDANGARISSAMTFIARRAVDGAAVSATFLIVVAPEPSFESDGTVVVTDATRAEVSDAVRRIVATGGRSTVVVSPAIVAALDSSGSAEDRELLASLDRALAGRHIVNTTFGGADPSAMAAAGLSGEFGNQLALGRAVLTDLLPSAVVETRTWVAFDELDVEGLALLRNSGITSLLLAPGASENAERSDSPLVLGRARMDNGDAVAVVTAGRFFVPDPTAAPAQSAARAAAGALVAVDDLLADGVPPSSIRLVLARDGAASADESLGLAASMLAAHPGISARDMSEPGSVDQDTPDVSFTGNGPRYEPDHARLLALVRTEMSAVSSMLDGESTVDDSWARMFALGTRPGSDDSVVRLTELRTRLRDVRELVTVTTPDTINLSSREGEIGVQVRNNSDEEMTVLVSVSSAKLRIERPVTSIVLLPKSTGEVRVPATSRTNGRFPVAIRVSTPEGDVDVVPWFTITAKVSAIAGFGQLVSITLLLVLLAWWWSHIRAVRQRAAEGDTVSVQ